ncbi:hypothetical protein NS330_14545 [Curtobacterium citreum]|nr:hypothetical protein NS330_14545 [Curtobacterium citreum]
MEAQRVGENLLRVGLDVQYFTHQFSKERGTVKDIRIVTAASVAVVVAGAMLGPAAGASAQPEQSTPAMQHAASESVPAPTGAEADDLRAIGGVAKALYSGFKAATSPRDAAKVLSWASVVGRSSIPDETTKDIEADYFDQ